MSLRSQPPLPPIPEDTARIENGGEKVVHGSGGMIPRRAA